MCVYMYICVYICVSVCVCVCVNGERVAHTLPLSLSFSPGERKIVDILIPPYDGPQLGSADQFMDNSLERRIASLQASQRQQARERAEQAGDSHPSTTVAGVRRICVYPSWTRWCGCGVCLLTGRGMPLSLCAGGEPFPPGQERDPEACQRP